jgi:predicted transcriptional regulator
LFRLAENQATANAILAHIRFHNGSVTITRLSLGHLEPGTPPTIEQMEFVVVLDVPNEGRR